MKAMATFNMKVTIAFMLWGPLNPVNLEFPHYNMIEFLDGLSTRK